MTTKQPKPDLRNARAKARDDFFERNASLLKSTTSGVYLRNRLVLAFIAGWDAAKREAAR